MNQKIMFGCIGAAALIVLVSFTSVISIQTAESSIKRSPLFGIRTQKATDVKEKTLTTFDYIKAEYAMSSLPLLENKLKYVFGIDVSLGQKEEIMNKLQNDHLLQYELSKLFNKDMSKDIIQFLKLIDDPYNNYEHTAWNGYCFPLCLLFSWVFIAAILGTLGLILFAPSVLFNCQGNEKPLLLSTLIT